MKLFRVPAPAEYLRKFSRGHCSEIRDLYIYILPGMEDHPEGLPLAFQMALSEVLRGLWIRPWMRYLDGSEDVPTAICDWSYRKIPDGSLLVGVGIGGTVACGLQDHVKDLLVYAVNSPVQTEGYEVHPAALPGQRVVFFNSMNPNLYGVQDWRGKCDVALDLPFLNSEILPDLPLLASLIGYSLMGRDLHEVLQFL